MGSLLPCDPPLPPPLYSAWLLQALLKYDHSHLDSGISPKHLKTFIPSPTALTLKGLQLSFESLRDRMAFPIPWESLTKSLYQDPRDLSGSPLSDHAWWESDMKRSVTNRRIPHATHASFFFSF